MGLFDFVREAGRRIFGGGETRAEAPELSPAEKAAADQAKADVLVQEVKSHGLAIQGLWIRFSNGVATIRGTASSQAEREKAVLAVGNVQGVGQVDDQMTVAEPEPQATFYTVQRGDTLSKIAREFYGKASKYPVIFEANRPMLSDPDKIYPGQVLRIPPQD